jgi:hypothetical protein
VSAGRADLLIVGACLWTDGAVIPGPDAIAVAGGRIVALDRAPALDSLRGPATEILDARGASVTPGCTDAHLHLLAWARSLEELSLHGLDSAGVARAVAAFARGREGSGPIVGRGWDAADWPQPPHRRSLDEVEPVRPVLLHSKDYHALWVNGAALAAAGVDRGTADPPGGRFERDAAGELTGVVREHAVRRFTALEPPPGEGDPRALDEAVRRLHAAGVTAVHDFEGPAALRAVLARVRRGRDLRVLMQLAHPTLDEALAVGIESGVGDDGFRVGAVKLFADGTLGSRTAAMLEPYDGGGGTGMDLLPPAALAADVARALAGGIAVAVHAIGDRAVRNVVDAFEAAAGELRRPALPSRIEHVQLARPADLARMARLGLVASMQPSHCPSDIPLAERWWGARRDRAYAWRSAQAAGALLAFGSDAPVEPPSVVLGLHAAVTRQRPDRTPEGGWVPGERLALDEALAAYTAAPARLAGSHPRLGSLRVGAKADIVVWDSDLHGIDPGRLPQVRPSATLVAGRVVHRAAAGQAREDR